MLPNFLVKVLEKKFHTQNTDFLDGNHLLDPLQTGFLQHNSMETALLKLMNYIRTGLDKKRLTLLLLFSSARYLILSLRLNY